MLANQYQGKPMAEEEVKESKDGGKKKNIVLFIIIGVVVMLLLIGGILAAVLMSGSDQPPMPIEQGVGGGADMGAPPSASDRASRSSLLTVGPMYPMDQFIVNLMSQGGKRYLKTTITLEMSDKSMVAEIEKKHAVLRDVVIGVMSSKTVEEISTSRGKDKLKSELIGAINEVMVDGHIKNLFFTDFVIQ